MDFDRDIYDTAETGSWISFQRLESPSLETGHIGEFEQKN